ncbi:MAG: DNA cytosine methyltransferase [Vampirovibrionia bacterium]
MKVLELFAGSRSIGKASEELGHEVFSSDINDFEGIDYVGDIRDFQVSDCPFVPDVIWASPPCTGFSVAAIGRNWVKGEIFTPKTESARLGVEILDATLDLITEFIKINPEVIWFIENPRGKMRKSPRLKEISHFMIRRTVTYCQYGDERMKPTDIWTNNFYWKPRPACKNGDPCYVAAPRGSQTGTQGLKGNYERSKIPHELCLEVIKECDYE